MKYTASLAACMAAALLTGCSSGAAPIAEQQIPAETKEITMPDLTAAGIDTSVFTKSAEPYTEELPGAWFYNSAPPTYQFALYTSPDGAQLAFDDQGRVVRFRNTPEICNADFQESEYGEINATDTVNSFLACVLSADNPVTIQYVVHTCDGSREEGHQDYYDFIEEMPCGGYVTGEITYDGIIQRMDIDYYTPETDVNAKKYDVEAQAIIDNFAIRHQDEIPGEIIEKVFIQANGYIYGSYSILSDFGSDCGTYVVLVRQDHEEIPFIAK